MKKYVSIPVFSCGLAALLLLISFSLSGTRTTTWNSEPCQAGTQNGFPLPFIYFMTRSSNTAPLLHSTAVCTSSTNVDPTRVNVPAAAIDYLFWFVVSLPIIAGLTVLSIRTTETESVKQEKATILEAPLQLTAWETEE